jgi:hypothetical protein
MWGYYEEYLKLEANRCSNIGDSIESKREVSSKHERSKEQVE